MQQYSLLDEAKAPEPQVSGLSYIADYVDEPQEAALIQVIDQQPWITDLKRRVQHYGYRYDYKARNAAPESLGPLPDWLQTYCNGLCQQGHFPKTPDQIIINEYVPGQGISPHIDVTSFGETIGSLSLGSPCVMEFTHSSNGQKVPVLLQQRSLVLLNGPARYEWQHSIPARKSDRILGQIITRSRRLSLTFRTVK